MRRKRHQRILISFYGCVILLLTFACASHYYTYFKKEQTNKKINENYDLQYKEINQVLSSLPISFLNKHQDDFGQMYYKNSSCAPIPEIYNLKFNNIYWQTFKMDNVTFQLYKAYYDNRKLNDLSKSVRVLTMMDQTDIKQQVYCQFWFENKLEPLIVKSTSYTYIFYHEWIDPKPGDYGPYIVNCELPNTIQDMPPTCVSLVENPCDKATNLLKVIYNIPQHKQEFAVCVKGLDFYDVDYSARLVEWIELLDIMGVSKIFFYQLNVHLNILKVLNYYVNIGKAEVTLITLPDGQPNIPILQHEFLDRNIHQQSLDELIPYNDCFYNNMYSFKYIVLLDVDEIIVPLKDLNWSSLLKRITKIPNTFASYNVRNVYFLDSMTPNSSNTNIPIHMHMLKHTYRSANFSERNEYVKSFFIPNDVIAVHNHLPLHFSEDKWRSYAISPDDAQLNHYRRNCFDTLDCYKYKEHIVNDQILWQYKDRLISRVNHVLKYIGIV